MIRSLFVLLLAGSALHALHGLDLDFGQSLGISEAAEMHAGPEVRSTLASEASLILKWNDL